ncbi:hypothetical protein D3C80_2005490 [compost metagenome]
MAVTATCGGRISGYCATGKARNAASPPSRMMMEITMANMGRSMKKREITINAP